MKKLIPILFALFLFAGCGDKGEDTYCWRFDKTQVWTSPSGAKSYYHSSTKQCGLTEEEAEIIRQGYDVTWYQGATGNRTKIEQTATKTQL